MDWKLDQKKREKRQAMLKNISSPDVNILGEMERDFAQIFGGNGSAGFFSSRGKAGDPVRRSEISPRLKAQKPG